MAHYSDYDNQDALQSPYMKPTNVPFEYKSDAFITGDVYEIYRHRDLVMQIKITPKHVATGMYISSSESLLYNFHTFTFLTAGDKLKCNNLEYYFLRVRNETEKD